MAIGEVTIFSSLCFIIPPWIFPVLHFLFLPPVLPTLMYFLIGWVLVGTFFVVVVVSLSSTFFGTAVVAPQGSFFALIVVFHTLLPWLFFSLLVLICFIRFLAIPWLALPFLPFLLPSPLIATFLVFPSLSEAFLFLQLIEDCFIFPPRSAFSALIVVAFRGSISPFPCRVVIVVFRFGWFIHIWTPSITYRF